MTPSQRLYCLCLRHARGKGYSLDEARYHAHVITNTFLEGPDGEFWALTRLPFLDWADIYQAPSPPPTRKRTQR